MKFGFLQRTVEVGQSLYHTAFGDSLILSPDMAAQLPIPGLRTQVSFQFYCLYNAILTSRVNTDVLDGYLLSIGAQKRLPPFKRIPVGIKPLRDMEGDDREMGESMFYFVDHRPFATEGVLFHSVEGIAGYYIPADVSPEGVVEEARRLHAHIVQQGVGDFYQV